MIEPAAAIRANLTGALWMTAAMAGFAVEDAFLKRAALSLPIAQLLVMFGAGGAALFAMLALSRGERLVTPYIFTRAMGVRVGFELTGRLFYTLAIALTPLSSATAILQATPIVVVLGAVVVFGERVGWRRWAAIFAGLLGVLVILRPAGESFSPLSLLAVIGMLGFAGRDLASRAAPLTLSSRILGVYGFATIVLAGLIYAAWEGRGFVWPDRAAALAILGAVGIGVFGYNALMQAMRTGDVSVVTPFRYTRLLFGLALGMALFGERPDTPMLIGCAIVVASGLFLLIRGRRA
ncbi:DMT family transporter [Roseovarius sp. SCSIO 43702]|uniref:DMT family transporter n=1 Tax=Roseovarius sp. SCSIO 43702 TaxID=2823043 RepID=UPI001C73ADBF|nr:DMT family transporter [Roseovarius sp. SCSIO 43702]QYX57257.1 DMT family transporter [Roseovarius sp. SCSIO 43702]